MTEIIPVTPREAPRLSKVASAVVKEHFDPLIGPEQNDYMIARFQSVDAIRRQLADGYRYHWVLEDGETAGFMAFFPRDGKMYLSKFYILRDFRGRHLAKKMWEFLLQETRKEGLTHIFLNVNKGNTDVIAIYEHLGLRIVRAEKNDIGSGFYMDDYVMECPV